MNAAERNFELPKNIERHLATLSKLYALEGQRQKQAILVNAKVRVHEEWSRDNWDGGTYGHALYLLLPENLYLEAVREKKALQSEIRSDINKIHNVPQEFIEELFLEMEIPDEHDWRRESGILQSGQHRVSPGASSRIWGESGYRVFLSHKAEVKAEVARLKQALGVFGISAFVAHEDIHPTEKWQEEIENALSTMEAFVALMTEDFHESFWTDQEVGYALGRAVPIIAVKLGRDPYGFIGEFQALICGWTNAPMRIAALLMKYPAMLDVWVAEVKRCPNFDAANLLADLLPSVVALSTDQIEALVTAYNSNDEISGSFGFKGSWPGRHGDGLATHLSRIAGRAYEVSSTGQLGRKP